MMTEKVGIRGPHLLYRTIFQIEAAECTDIDCTVAIPFSSLSDTLSSSEHPAKLRPTFLGTTF